MSKIRDIDDEKFLEEEFLGIMKEKFLNGEDDFDYKFVFIDYVVTLIHWTPIVMRNLLINLNKDIY